MGCKAVRFYGPRLALLGPFFLKPRILILFFLNPVVGGKPWGWRPLKPSSCARGGLRSGSPRQTRFPQAAAILLYRGRGVFRVVPPCSIPASAVALESSLHMPGPTPFVGGPTCLLPASAPNRPRQKVAKAEPARPVQRPAPAPFQHRPRTSAPVFQHPAAASQDRAPAGPIQPQ